MVLISAQAVILTRQKGIFMPATNRSELAETIFKRTQRRETEINQALAQEEARRAAVVANMHRLRQLRLQREEKSQASS